MFKKLLAATLAVGLLAGCSNMTQREQRALSGGALGAVTSK
jgi:hypothetical protein